MDSTPSSPTEPPFRTNAIFMQNKYIHTPGTTTKAERYTMPPLHANEVFHRIIDEDGPAEEHRVVVAVVLLLRLLLLVVLLLLLLVATVVYLLLLLLVVVFHPRRVYNWRMIPAGEFEADDFMDMVARLELVPIELARTLSRMQYRGIAGIFINTLAEIDLFGPIFQERFMQRLQRRQQQPRAPRLNAVKAVPPPEEVCAICLETCSDTPGKGWSTAEGCSAHRFHTECILKWTAGTCPICRRELLGL
jgi:hypothetical protein